MNDDPVMAILHKAKLLAIKYYRLTGKPLGITGEVAEYEAARILGVKLTPARTAGYDATERKNGTIRKLQIKGRRIFSGKTLSQRVGSIGVKKEWDAVLLVLLDERFDATAIYEAERSDVTSALTRPGSIARNQRGALSVSLFKRIGRLRWSKAKSQKLPG